ncbi:hypothetical protein SAY87_000161 [Trapa incisa]|uniref:Uncharacterized protein n=1 Tax=Trapa incisa TaxID=236973 RepID=A0AAN7GBA7_9MYRT|nr:hypothetical protein SAY87_000161 [Trapa incisa]
MDGARTRGHGRLGEGRAPPRLFRGDDQGRVSPAPLVDLRFIGTNARVTEIFYKRSSLLVISETYHLGLLPRSRCQVPTYPIDARGPASSRCPPRPFFLSLYYFDIGVVRTQSGRYCNPVEFEYNG